MEIRMENGGYRYSRGSKRKKNKQEMARGRERGGAFNWIERQLKRGRDRKKSCCSAALSAVSG